MAALQPTRGPLARLLRSAITLALMSALASAFGGQKEATAPQIKDRWVANTGSDRASGTRLHPWATLIHASELARPGMIIHVLPGIYSGPLVTKKAGTADLPVRYAAESKWKAKVMSSTTADAVWQNDGDYVEISGFEISGVACVGILNNGSHVTIIENHVHNLAFGDCPEGGAGIDNGNSAASDGTVVKNVIDHIGDPHQPSTKIHGIYQANAGGHITGNIAVCNAGWGIHLWHAATQADIEGNIVARNGAGGIVVGAGDEPGDIVDDHTVVAKNVVWGNRKAIVEFGQTGPHNQFQNNWIYGNEENQVKLVMGKAEGTVDRDPRNAKDSPAAVPDWVATECDRLQPFPVN